MPGSKESSSSPPGSAEPVRVLVEIRMSRDQPAAQALESAAALSVPGFQLDTDYEPMPVGAPPEQAAAFEAARESLVLVRGTVADESGIEELEKQDNVFSVWRDTPIAPFGPASGSPAR